MSVIIKGMKMPDSCIKCCCCDDVEGFCHALSKYFPRMLDASYKLPDCPLVALPEKHGRLIDADEKRLRITLKGIREGECQIYKGGSWGFAAKAETAIDDAPTVFEAE